MNQLRRDEFKQKLYELTPPDGRAISNPALRESLQNALPEEQFSLDDYWDLRNSLITDGKLEKGRGRGGSVNRVLAETEPAVEGAPSAPAAPEIARVAEVALYEPFQKCIQEGYVPDNDIKPWICEITAFQGKRNTGGVWTRPDVTLIAIQTFVFVPTKQFDVVTFEIKPSVETAIEGVYECAAHSAFANRSYLAFPDSDSYDTNPLYDRIADECERFGLGLILFNVADWDTYSFEISARRNNPDPRNVNDFIKVQISEKSREEIQRWFR